MAIEKEFGVSYIKSTEEERIACFPYVRIDKSPTGGQIKWLAPNLGRISLDHFTFRYDSDTDQPFIPCVAWSSAR